VSDGCLANDVEFELFPANEGGFSVLAVLSFSELVVFDHDLVVFASEDDAVPGSMVFALADAPVIPASG
jgi:hypothetical protein